MSARERLTERQAQLLADIEREGAVHLSRGSHLDYLVAAQCFLSDMKYLAALATRASDEGGDNA